MRPPVPSLMRGLSTEGDTASSSSDDPTHTLPVFSLIKATVLPPTEAVVCALRLVCILVLSVEDAMAETLVGSAKMVVALCCAMSNRGEDETTLASASRFLTLKRAAF